MPPLAVRRAISRGRPGLVHGFQAEPSNVATAAARLCGFRPVAVSKRNLMTRPETFAGEKCLERWVLRRDDNVLGNSTTVIEELRNLGVSPNKLGLIANGIDPYAFEDARSRCELRAALGWPAEGVIVLSLANIITYKGK